MAAAVALPSASLEAAVANVHAVASHAASSETEIGAVLNDLDRWIGGHVDDNKEARVRAYGTLGVIGPLLAWGRALPTSSLVVQPLLTCVAHLAREEVNCEPMYFRDGVPALVCELMSRNADDAVALRTALVCLQNLAFVDVNLEPLCSREGAHLRVVDVLRHFPDSVELLIRGTNVLRCLASAQGNVERIFIKSEAVDCVMGAMRRHLDHEELQASGCLFLAELAQNERFRRGLHDVGVGKAVLAAARRFPSNADTTEALRELKVWGMVSFLEGLGLF